jgi:hypothetical protein
MERKIPPGRVTDTISRWPSANIISGGRVIGFPSGLTKAGKNAYSTPIAVSRDEEQPMGSREEMEDLFGPAAPYSEHKRGETITYRLPGEAGEYVGVIIWCVEAIEQVGLHYIVERAGAGDSFPDIVFPAFILS